MNSADFLKIATPETIDVMSTEANRMADDLAALRAENKRLREALQRIIDENPDPKLPYGRNIVAIARAALAAAPTAGAKEQSK